MKRHGQSHCNYTYSLLLFVLLAGTLPCPAARPEMVLQLGDPFSASVWSWADRAPVYAAGTEDGVQIWDSRTWELRRTLPIPRDQPGQSPSPLPLALSPNGKTLAALTVKGLQIWDVPTGRLYLVIPTGTVTSVDFTPDGKEIVGNEIMNGALPGTAVETLLWDADTGRLVRRFPVGGTFALTHDGRRIAVVQGDRATLWNMVTGRRLRTFSDRSGLVEGPLALSPDDRLLATTGENPQWHGPGINPEGGAPTEAAYAHDLTVKIWDVRTGRRVRVLPGQSNQGRQQLGWTTDGDLVSVGTETRVWDARKGTRCPHIATDVGRLSPDGNTLIADTGRDLVRTDLRTGARRRRRKTFFSLTPVNGAAWSPDGRCVAVGEVDGPQALVRLWDLNSLRSRWTWPRPNGDLRRLSFRPDSRAVIVTDTDTTSTIATRTGRRLAAWPTLQPPLQNALVQGVGVLSPEGRRWAGVTLSFNRGHAPAASVGIWDARTWTRQQTIPIPTGCHPLTLAWSPDGGTLAIRRASETTRSVEGMGVFSGDVLLWDVHTDRPIRALPIGPGLNGGGALAFSRDGHRLAAAQAGLSVVYNLTSGRRLWSHRERQSFDLSLQALAFSPDGSHLLTGGDTGVTRLWRITDGRLLLTLLGLSAPAGHTSDWLAFAPDNDYAASPGGERAIRWRVGNTLYPSVRYAARFHRPALLRRALTGR